MAEWEKKVAGTIGEWDYIGLGRGAAGWKEGEKEDGWLNYARVAGDCGKVKERWQGL